MWIYCCGLLPLLLHSLLYRSGRKPFETAANCDPRNPGAAGLRRLIPVPISKRNAKGSELGLAAFDELLNLLITDPKFFMGFDLHQLQVDLVEDHGLAALLIHDGIDLTDHH